MKIGEYEQMMAYLTRPGFKDGSPLMPEPKPFTSDEFKLKADLLIKGALGGFPKDEMIMKLQEQLDKVQESGTMEKEEAIQFIKERAQQLKDFIKENPGENLPGFQDGGIVDRQNLGRGYLAGAVKNLGKKYKGSTLEAILENPKLMGTEIGYEGLAEALRLLGLYSVGGRVGKKDD